MIIERLLNPLTSGLGPRLVLSLGFLSTGVLGTLAQTPTALKPDPDRQARVAQLVSQMTLAEKVGQMQNHAPAIPRLGIPAYDYWNEGLHGSARSGYSTMFPQAIGLAATWDTRLLHDVAETISVEARAKHTEAVKQGNHDIYYGVTIWSPNINIFRDPRWGRGQETYGEDPFLTSRLGVAFVSGMQGDDPTYLRAIATPKHFAVHSGPESERHRFNVPVSPHDYADTYLPAFRATVTEAHAQSVMCAYNSVDGEPACANKHLLDQTLRKAWNFDGFVTSDCWAVTDIWQGHKFAPDEAQASVLAVRAGTDTSCGREFGALAKAVERKQIAESELDTAVRRLFLGRFRLGLFDPPAKVNYEQLPFSEVDSDAHRQLALRAARESMVLLKNEHDLLPLAKKFKSIAVIGPNAASLAALEGNYNAIPSHPVTPLASLYKTYGANSIHYAQGSSFAEGMRVPVPQTVLTAKQPQTAGLTAEYFDNTRFSGKPILERVDDRIDFDWDAASPGQGVPANAFSARWTGSMTMPAPGDYTFDISLSHCYPCHDVESYDVFLDGKLQGHERWDGQDSRSDVAKPFVMAFADTKPHDLRVEYTHASDRFGAGITMNWLPPAAVLRDQAVAIARQADVVVAFVGLSPDLEGEEMTVKVEGFSGGDRTDIGLPRAQQQLLEAVAATGKPLVVILMNGSALAVNWAQAHAAAILEAWYPGEEGGTAIAETLFGTNNPSGRLPVTFYKSTDQLPAFTDYSMKNRTYRYSKAEPLFRFGSGLSYSTFAYTAEKLSASSIAAGDPLRITAHVANTGKLDGDEVVEAYLIPPRSDGAPIHSLAAFRRIFLAAGESRDIALSIDPRQLSSVDAAGHRAILPGDYRLYIGGSQPSTDAASLPFQITGSKALPE